MGKQPKSETSYANRRKKIIKQLKGEAAIFPAAPHFLASRDQHHPFRQNSDFFYLTGLTEPQAVLFLTGSTKGPRSVLFLRERNDADARWNGERIGIKRAKRRFDVDEVRDITQLENDLPELAANCSVLHYAPGGNPVTDPLIWRLLQNPSGPRLNFPHTLKDSRLITAAMRFVKDRYEIQHLKHAAGITAKAFLNFLPQAKLARSEKHAAQILEAEFARCGAHGLAFPTIVASGRNATTLHHEPKLQPLWKHELVLVDCGAVFQGYCADLTRTFPVSGTFREPQARVYDAVHRALHDALDKTKPGSTLEIIHAAALRAITSGLISLGILKGSVSDLVQREAYRNYFMHRTSHWLGLDVHDAFPLLLNNAPIDARNHPLEPGHVITIEPGIYLDAKDESVPVQYRGIGVRLEESVLITTGGCAVLTAHVPTAREDIEALLAPQTILSREEKR